MSDESSQAQPYRVLARKYRPQNFAELIGQDALVRTLTNAIESNRIHHAYMLTGVRGVGKTTTARIIAKALNYTGPDGKAAPTTGDTSDCEICRAIAEDRHPDVLEMDAASNTGIDDIREIIDGVRYAPASARYKVYIIDEVHMLSKQAFNALLKTLEEPPSHVIFIFATTEIRKVPITILSRCQRFDLRRVEVDMLQAHYKSIGEKEKVAAEDDALAMIARAADGSVRDGLSLLDQAIALGNGSVTVEQVKDMLGLADRGATLELMDGLIAGDAPAALDKFEDMRKNGADPVVVLQDLLETTHLLSRLCALPDKADIVQTVNPDALTAMKTLAEKLTMPALQKIWTILLAGLQETSTSTMPQQSAEMTLMKVLYAAKLPDPADLIRRLQSERDSGTPTAPPPKNAASAAPAETAPAMRVASGNGAPATVAAPAPALEDEMAFQASTIGDIVEALEENGYIRLAVEVRKFVHPIKVTYGKIDFRPAEDAPTALSGDLGQALKNLTGQRWMISLSQTGGEPTLAERAAAEVEAQRQEILATPMMAEIIKYFPDAEITNIIEEKE